ncbi:TPM domain-containing protein [Sphingomonas sp. NSE70-1]|uniref:TPM domain-containing protein n=1 Tax=Sphingomonas caseinilyticus TaxID=2908205 RepID=A0ABT0RSV3_9SPHN|nr:TPM domain-containing protein [Sphingomonas caseinilyticus]MCL6698089.1 TPM domain-containing protein [Sphingomonas caseinilyticus]
MGPSLRWGDVIGLLLAAFMLLVSSPAHAQTFPKLTGRVVDQANLLSPAEEADLSAKSDALEKRTGRQFVIATVSSLEGRPIEDYGYRLGREWKIGDEQKDDGVILLVAPAERKVRIETGYGARVFLTDALSSIIIRESILPRFKAGDLPGGISAGADQIVKQMELPEAEAAKRAQEIGAKEAKRQDRDVNPIPVIFIVIIFFVIIGSIARAAGGRRYRGKGRRRGGLDSGDVAVILWGLDALTRGSRGSGGWGGGGWGGGGGGFGGFSGGGGSFGGGGASGGW